MDNAPSFESCMELADQLPYGKERILIREKAINLADLTGKESDMYEARVQFVEDLCKAGGYSEKYFSVFPWLLEYAHNKGSSYERMYVLLYYKWVILEMGNYPSVSRFQLEAALEDLRTRYLDFGSNEKVYHQYAYSVYADNLKDLNGAHFHYTKWLKFKQRDQLDDCEACVTNRHLSLLINMGELEMALKVAAPILSGKQSCTHVPKDTWSNLLLPVYTKGDLETSKLLAEKLSRKLASMKYDSNVAPAHTLIIYYTKVQEYLKAVKWLEKFFPIAIDQKELNGKFFFYTAATYLFGHLPKESVKLRLPRSFALFSSSGVYIVHTLAQWFDNEANKIAELFDKRNGNTGYSQQKQELLNR